MENDGQLHAQVWYIRKGGEVKGPFPRGMIRRFVLLGRLLPEDEASEDKQHWHRIEDVTVLMPAEMRSVTTEEDRQRLLAARLREDERLQDRRDRHSGATPGRRHGPERRRPEAAPVLRHRANRAELLQKYNHKEDNRVPATIVTVVLLALLGLGIYLYRNLPRKAEAPIACDSAPVPGVVWSNCNLKGLSAPGVHLARARIDNANLRGADLRAADLSRADLAYSDLSASVLAYGNLQSARLLGAQLRDAVLSHAKIQGADLSYADLRGALLEGADLRGARLSKTLWIDGRVCAAGSVGRCVFEGKSKEKREK